VSIPVKISAQPWLRLEADRIIVTTSYAFADICRSLPGARWDKRNRFWHLPRTPWCAFRAVQALTPDDGTVPVSGAFYDYVKQQHENWRVAVALRKMPVKQLAPLGITALPPWGQQLRAFHFARLLPAAMLALDMGTGKTKVVIDLIMNLHLLKTLVIGPHAAVSEVWPEEAVKHCPKGQGLLAVSLIKKSGAKRVEDAQFVLSEFDRLLLQPIKVNPYYDHLLILLNYEAAWREPMAGWLLQQNWDLIVLDESHRIKKAGGVASHFLHRLGAKAPRRLALTGTPMPHSPLDLYAQYRFLDVGVFGSRMLDFRERYAVMGGYMNLQVRGFKNLKHLRRRFNSISMTVKADDVQDLPPSVTITRRVTLEPQAQKLYDALNDELEAWVSASRQVTVNNALTKLLRLQEITSGFVSPDRTTDKKPKLREISQAKRTAIREWLEDLPPKEPVVVFSRFTHDLDVVRQEAENTGRSVAELSGRVKELRLWRDGERNLLNVQVQSGKESIDLTRARYAAFYSRTFSLGDYQQAIKRLVRPGQQHKVFFYHFIVPSTVDADIMESYRTKEDIIQLILRRIRGKR